MRDPATWSELRLIVSTSEINRLSRQLAIRERSNTPMSAMTMSLPGAGSTNRRGVEHDNSSERLESIHATPNVIGRRPPWFIASLMTLSTLRGPPSQGMR